MNKLSLLVVFMVVLIECSSTLTSAQDVQIPDCVNKLDICGPFINSTTIKPPATCCKPLKLVLKNDLSCICSLFGSLELIQTLSLNVTEALTLPKRCGSDLDLIKACQALMAPTKAPSSAPHKHHKHPHKQSMSPAPGPAPGPPGLSTGDATSKTISIGSVFGSLLLWATIMFY